MNLRKQEFFFIQILLAQMIELENLETGLENYFEIADALFTCGHFADCEDILVKLVNTDAGAKVKKSFEFFENENFCLNFENF